MLSILTGVISTTRKVKIPNYLLIRSHIFQQKEERLTVGCRGQGSCAGSNSQGRVFRGHYSGLVTRQQCERVKHTQPRNGQQTDSKEEVKQEKHDGRHQAGRVAAVPDGTGQDSHAGTLSGRGKKHQLPTSKSIIR